MGSHQVEPCPMGHRLGRSQAGREPYPKRQRISESITEQVSNEKKNSYVGIIINRYKDPGSLLTNNW